MNTPIIRSFLVFFILLLCRTVAGQSINIADSLETQLVLVSDSQKTVLLQQLIPYYLTHDPDVAMKKAADLQDLGRDLSIPEVEAEALTAKGMATVRLLADLDKAMVFFLEALEIYENNNRQGAGLIRTLMEISRGFSSIGDHYQALDYLFRAQTIVQQEALTDYEAKLYLMIGEVYGRLNDTDESVRHFRLARQSVKNDSALLSLIYREYGRLFHQIGNFEQAIQYFDSAQSAMNDQEEPALAARLNLLKGRSAQQFNQYEHSISYLKNALDQIGVDRHLSLQSEVLNEIGKVFIIKGEADSAYQFFSQALPLAVRANNKVEIRKCYENLYQYYLLKEDFENAEEYKDLFIEISEFINTEQSGRKMLALQTQYELGKKEAEITNLRKDAAIRQLELEQQANEQKILIILVVTISTIAIISFLLFRNKRQANIKLAQTNQIIEEQNASLSALNTTKDKFFSIIGHDVKGPINSLTSFSNLLINHTDSLSKKEIQTLATDLDKSLKNLYTLLENLLNWARSQTGNIELQPENIPVSILFEENIQLLNQAASAKSINLRENTPEGLQCYADKNTLTTVIRNLISNAIKFTPEGGRITLSAEEWKDAVEISVTDTGVGMSEEVRQKLFKIDQKHSTLGTNKEKGTGLGLILCKEFTELNGGTISVTSTEGKGSTFSVTLPSSKH
jgi:signal transduction histidine kinase